MKSETDIDRKRIPDARSSKSQKPLSGNKLSVLMVQGGYCGKARVKITSERQMRANYSRLVGHGTEFGFYYECDGKALKHTVPTCLDCLPP